jgi:hypothetical protein
MQYECAILSTVACPALQNFTTLSHKKARFSKKVIEHKMFSFSVQLLSETFLILRITERDQMYVRLQVTYLLFFSDFNRT